MYPNRFGQRKSGSTSGTRRRAVGNNQNQITEPTTNEKADLPKFSWKQLDNPRVGAQAGWWNWHRVRNYRLLAVNFHKYKYLFLILENLGRIN